MASKRKSLCIDEKVLLIRAIERGEKISAVGKRFGFSRSTVSTIWKNKEKILQAEGVRKSSKKLKKPKYEDLDQAILLWFHRQRKNNMPVSGPLVKAKAKNFAEELGLTSFKASEGWLIKFKQRHQINYGKISGEEQSVDTNVTPDWTKTEVREQDEEDETDELEPPPSDEEALNAAKLLENYFLYHQDASISKEINKIIINIQQKYWCNKRRQTKIQEYMQ
ncbi:tigger transposable element-derived protein 4-like [Vanessa cardui]|uniref:tigger transposable element-derived protein 4-like n=1 Tax=Vanessa cardui TaxID=171605 RepID=UPI001F145891|nr:tigger transposable element-derived protein 4-like [Vanessa cardui]